VLRCIPGTIGWGVTATGVMAARHLGQGTDWAGAFICLEIVGPPGLQQRQLAPAKLNNAFQGGDHRYWGRKLEARPGIEPG